MLGQSRARSDWHNRLSRLSSTYTFAGTQWSGDLFEKANPLWRSVGILKPNARGNGYSQVNNGATRTTAARMLRAILTSQSPILDGERIVRATNA